jgi:ATP-dependent helicase/nuclease subunit B
MSVRFILGRSGSGKTQYCLESVRAELRRSDRSESLILLVPEQATFQIEQSLLADGSLPGYARATVVSFGRLARVILQQTHPPALPPLSETGKQMILRRLLQQHQSELTIFARSADRGGFVAQLSRMISELLQYQKTPEQLLQQRGQIRQKNDPASTPLLEKLSDLAVIFQAYQQYIADRFIDPDEFLNLMSQHCSQAEILKPARLWVDGFAGFTPQQFTVLESLLATVDQTALSLCLDPLSKQFLLAQKPDTQYNALLDTDLFHPVLQTYLRLNQLRHKLNLPQESPILLPAYSVEGPLLPRYRNSPVLAQLEVNWIRQSQIPIETQTSTTQIPMPAEAEIPIENIVLVETPHRRREVKAVARHILRLCREHDYRFRDIAVILRDIEPYRELIEAVFADHGISFFLDQRRTVRHHPLIELLRSVLAILCTHFKTEHVLRYLKTDFVPIPRSAVDTLENFALARGIQANRWYDPQPWRFHRSAATEKPFDSTPDIVLSEDLSAQQLNGWRRQAVEPLRQMFVDCFGDTARIDQTLTVRQVTAALFRLIQTLQVPQTLSQWTEQAQAEKNLDSALSHQQIYSQIITLLDELTDALGASEITITQFAEIFNTALSQMTLALVPPALDQVLVGAIERSRHPNIRAAFLLGVNEGVFPKFSQPDSLLTDRQRQQLIDAGFELGPTATEKLLHEQYLAYIALTRPGEFLWISFPLADEKGSELNPSPIIHTLRTVVENLPTVRLPESHEPDLETVTSVSHLMQQLACSLRDLPMSSLPNATQELIRYACARDDWSETVQFGLSGLTYSNRASLAESTLADLFSATVNSSVSRLESFAACPFQHYARYILHLQERQRLQLAAVDIGTFFHRALCRIFQSMQKENLSWDRISEDQVHKIVDTVTRSIAQTDEWFSQLIEQSQRNRFLIDHAIRKLNQFCRLLRQSAQASSFRQQEAELAFKPNGPLPALILDLKHNRRLALRGVIDRIDLAQKEDGSIGVSIVDYKTTTRRFSYEHFYHGLSLQLISYLLVMQNHYQVPDASGVHPAAALYLPILPKSITQSDHPPDEVLDTLSQTEPSVTPAKALGVLDKDWISALDNSIKPGSTSRFYDIRIKKDGSLGNTRTNSVVSACELQSLLTHCRHTLTDQAQQIIAGNIAVTPYRLGDKETPCTYCPFKALCRFDPTRDPYRQLPKLTKIQVLESLQ